MDLREIVWKGAHCVHLAKVGPMAGSCEHNK